MRGKRRKNKQLKRHERLKEKKRERKRKRRESVEHQGKGSAHENLSQDWHLIGAVTSLKRAGCE